MLKQFWLLFPLTAMLIAVGCSQAVAPTELNPGIPPGAMQGEYGYNINGYLFDSRNLNIIGSNVSLNDGSASGKILSMILFYNVPGSIVYGSVYLIIPIAFPGPQTVNVTNWGNGTLASALIERDSVNPVEYNSVPGGFVTITKFDTINNHVSGFFELSGTQSYQSGATQTMTITSGYFNELSIGPGAYGQGSITANIDGLSFTSQEKTTATAYGEIQNGLNLYADGSNNALFAQIDLNIQNPGVGNYPVDNPDIASASLGFEEPSTDGLQVLSKVAGQITLTSWDTLQNVVSGTFSFSGTDSSGIIHYVTNGLIDRVRVITH